MSKDSTIRCYDRQADAYDLYQRAVVPEYDTALETTALIVDRLLGKKAPGPGTLGCGTGNASAAILRTSPGARIFLLDGSASMVAAAEAKVRSISPSSFLGSKVADLASNGWDEGLAASGFDAVVSTLVMEHLDYDSYRAVLPSCFDLLSPGGWLLAVEGYAEEESDMLSWFEEMMDERRSLIGEPDLSDFISKLRSEEEVHHYASKSQKADWWREAGFERVHLLWQYLCIALMAGKRPPIR